MPSNLDRFRNDITDLHNFGRDLLLSFQHKHDPQVVEEHLANVHGKKNVKARLASLPDFASEYQRWYSESLAVLRQVLPDRVQDFIRHYEKPKARKSISFESYRIEDALQGLQASRGGEVIVNAEAAGPHLYQQIAILAAANARFESSLYDMRQLLQADLFDGELAAAKELSQSGFSRAAGALAGVVLERHLASVCAKRGLVSRKKHPGISEWNDLLKNAGAIELPQWRLHQHLGDFRNLCDHGTLAEPTAEQVSDLIAGTEKVTKTVF